MVLILFTSCESNDRFIFKLKSSNETKINFENNLTFDQEFNVNNINTIKQKI